MKTIIVFLLYLLGFVKPGIQQDFGSEAKHKRAVGPTPGNELAIPNELATLVYGTVRRKHPREQFAVLYLHPTGANDILDYENEEVRGILISQKPIPVYVNQFSWPQNPNTNLAVSGFTNDMQFPLGHSEWRLLRRLDTMLPFFKRQNGKNCPSHIIIATKRAPCYKKETKQLPASGCTKEIIAKFKKVRNDCKATQFVVGYAQTDPKYEKDWNTAYGFLQGARIIVTMMN